MDKRFLIGAALAAPKSTAGRHAIVRNDVVLPQANIVRHVDISSSSMNSFFYPTAPMPEFSDDSYYSNDLNEEAAFLDRMVQPDTNMDSFLGDDMENYSEMADPGGFEYASLSPVIAGPLDDALVASPSDMSMIHPQPAYKKADEEQEQLDADGLLFPDFNEEMVDLSHVATAKVEPLRTLQEKKTAITPPEVDIIGLEVKLVEPIAIECPADDIPVLTEEDLKALEFENYKPLRLQGVDFLQRVVAESEILVEPQLEPQQDIRANQWAAIKQRTISVISGSSTVEDIPPSCVSYDSSAYCDSGSDTASPSASINSPAVAPKTKTRKTAGRRKVVDEEEKAQRKRDQNAAAAYRYRMKKKAQHKVNQQALGLLKIRNRDLRKELAKLIDTFKGAQLMAQSLLM